MEMEEVHNCEKKWVFFLNAIGISATFVTHMRSWREVVLYDF